VEIPQYGTKHSLNVAVAGGIALYEAVRALERQGFRIA
jgi:tRNA G18 (ribose-2'-O)-methylase SpoU